MTKHYNLKHEVLIRSNRKDLIESDVKYKHGDPVKQKDIVRHCEYTFESCGELQRAFISREMIFDLYNQIVEIESQIHDGTYDFLPF